MAVTALYVAEVLEILVVLELVVISMLLLELNDGQ